MLDPDMKQFLVAQTKLMEALTSQLAKLQTQSTETREKHKPISNISKNVPEFLYDPDDGQTFEAWYRRFEDIFTIELANEEEEIKVRSLLRLLGPSEYNRYANFILPNDPRSLSFTETIEKLKKVFGERISLFKARYICLQTKKQETEDYVSYAGKIKQSCSTFKLGSLTEDQFHCLMFIRGLKASHEADLRTWLLAKLEQEPDIKLESMVDECQRFINLRKDSDMIQQTEPISINTVKSNKQPVTLDNSNGPQTRSKPNSPCHYCGSWHFHRFCPFKKHKCQKCNKFGHKEGFCKPKTANKVHPAPTRPKQSQRRITNTVFVQKQVNAVIKRQFVSVDINGVDIKFQLDTASDITIISHTSWKSLCSPKLDTPGLTAKSACGGKVKFLGKLQCQASVRDKTTSATCYVTKSNINLLGLDWLDPLGLWDLSI
jgi:hypothetical protein